MTFGITSGVPPFRPSGGSAEFRLQEAHVVRRSIEAVVATVDKADRCGGEFVGIKVVKQRHLNGVKGAPIASISPRPGMRIPHLLQKWNWTLGVARPGGVH
jgi:hypothetical protein